MPAGRVLVFSSLLTPPKPDLSLGSLQERTLSENYYQISTLLTTSAHTLIASESSVGWDGYCAAHRDIGVNPEMSALKTIL